MRRKKIVGRERPLRLEIIVQVYLRDKRLGQGEIIFDESRRIDAHRGIVHVVKERLSH